MNEEKLKDAFTKVKEDILSLNKEISEIKLEISEIKKLLSDFSNSLIFENSQNLPEIPSNFNSTQVSINTTETENSTQNSTHPQEIGGLKNPNLGISIGNEGVSTDRQTDRQTDKHMRNTPKNLQNNQELNIEDNIHEASEILDSLDKIKKQIRLKFKKVTAQEMRVFSTIYQLEEQDPLSSNYHQISLKLGLSESSIRDYVQRMIYKGIPIKKKKIDNKKVILQISSDLRKIVSLSTIMRLREL